MTAPSAPKRDHVHTEFGVERPDPWHWLKDPEDPATIEYLEAENAWTESAMAHLSDLRQALYDEMLGRIQEDDTSAPVHKGGHWYYRRTVEGQAYAIHCRRTGSPDADEQILLDENELADGQEYLSVSSLSVSPDHRRLAWLQDDDGAERFRLRIKDLDSGDMLADELTGLKWSLAWGDADTIFYTKSDDAQRPHQIWRHRLGTPADADVMVFDDPDELFFLSVDRTRDGRWVVLEAHSKETSEIRLVPTDASDSEPFVAWPRQPGVEAMIDSGHDRLYVVTNLDAPNFRLVSIDPSDPTQPPEEIVAHDADVYLERADAFEGHLVVWQRADGLPRLLVRRIADGNEHVIDFPDPSYELDPAGNPEFGTATFRFSYSSPVQPDAVIAYDLDERIQEIIKEMPVKGGYDRSRFTCRRLWATATDGTRVPITLAHRSDLEPDGSHPALLIGYGSYGFSYPVNFSSVRLSLLERGVVVAIAHIRGGSEMGRYWYENGKFFTKRNTFGDFIAAGEQLVADGWVHSDRLAISGGSAGGLLMGAVVNERPDLFAAVVAQVPFVDVVNTMLDASLPLTVPEYEEWGNPNEREVFDYLLTYSPYDNVEPKDYPAMFVTAGLNDPRVGFWEPAKWVAKLRDVATGDQPLLLRTFMGAGHGGQSGRYGHLEDTAWTHAFILDQLDATAG